MNGAIRLNVSVIVLVAAAVLHAQKPVIESPLRTSPIRPPATAPEMVASADAVIVAQWTGQARAGERTSPDGLLLPTRTFYTFRVEEVIKNHPSLPPLGQEIEFWLPGGDRELPTRIERVRDPKTGDLRPSGRYVLFADHSVRTGELYLAWGPLGVYEITNGRVAALRLDWPRHDGKDAGAFLREIRPSN